MPKSLPGSIPELPISSDGLRETLTTRLHSAIGQRLLEQELLTPEGAHLRLGVRKTTIAEEFFAENAETGESLSVRCHQPRRTKSGLIIKLNELRKLRPTAPLLRPGRLADLDFNPLACSFGCLHANAPGSILNRPVLLRLKAQKYEFAVVPQLVPLELSHVLLV